MQVAIASHTPNAQPEAARSSFWSAANGWDVMANGVSCLLAIAPDAARSGFLSRRSCVAPSLRSRRVANGPK